MKKVIISILLAGFASISTANANSSYSYRVAVFHQNQDWVGSRVALIAQNEIRQNRQYELVTDISEATFVLILSSLNLEQNNSRSAISISYIFQPEQKLYEGRYLDSFVAWCGTDHVAACARDYVSRLSPHISNLEGHFPNLRDSLAVPGD